MVRVGLCGIGFMGKMHYGVYSELKNAKVVAIADPSAKKRKGDWKDIMGNIPGKKQNIVDLSDVHVYSDFRKLVEDPDIDLVDITLPTPLHHEAALMAIKNGKHLLIEKPVARNTVLADKLIRAGKKAGKYVMVAQCIRFWPEYAMLKNWNKSGKFGKLRHLALRRVSPKPTYTVGNWILDGTNSGGAALDLHIHDSDFVAYLLGKPREVYSTGIIDKKEGGSSLITQYIYPGSVSVYAEGGWDYPSSFPFEMSYVAAFQKAVIEYNSNKSPGLVIYHGSGRKEMPKVAPGTGYSEEIKYLVTCIAKKQKPVIAPLVDGRNSVALIEAELKSLKSKRPVKPEYYKK